jgi:predicted transcriptional regulator
MARTKIREITIAESKGAFSLFSTSKLNKEDYDFEGISALRNLLSNEKARILHVIKNENPLSIYDLAKKLGRGFKAVMNDLRVLERFGFIEFTEEKVKNRTRHKPEIVIDTITIHIKI